LITAKGEQIESYFKVIAFDSNVY